MRTINFIFAISILVGGVSAAHSAIIAEFDVLETDTINVTVVPIYSSGGLGHGIATLDDAGLLTMHLSDTISIDWGTTYIYTTTAITTLSGSSIGRTFTPTSGNTIWTSCVDSGTGNACPFLNTPNEGAQFFKVGGALSAAGGTLTSALSQFGSIQKTYSTYILTPTVPVPAAVWLFGSGLMGLTGLARKRKAV